MERESPHHKFKPQKESATLKRHFESEMADSVQGLLLAPLDIIIIMSNPDDAGGQTGSSLDRFVRSVALPGARL